jgi:ribosomal protein S18 acetylase RimI-like enzyme
MRGMGSFAGNSNVDPQALARRMHELTFWLESQEDLVPERLAFDRAPFGRSQISIDPTSVAPAASMNRNRICLYGADGGLTKRGLGGLVEKFESRGVRRFFAWLSPGPGADEVREWLRTLSFTQVKWTRYPTMLLTSAPEAPRAHGFEIRIVGAAEVAEAHATLGDTLMEGYLRTAGKPGFTHYLLFDAGKPNAAAALVQFGDLGYLTWAGTAESHRRQGAQTALIAHRVAAAQALGYRYIVSQTLTMLEDSFANLQRCGFREVYEQEAYEYRPDP